MMRYRYSMMPWGGLFWLFCLITMVIAGIFIYKLTTVGRINSSKPINSNAVEILKERYAKGEIDEEQYRKMKDNIEK